MLPMFYFTINPSVLFKALATVVKTLPINPLAS